MSKKLIFWVCLLVFEMGMCTAIVLDAAQEPKRMSQIVLVSPNGKHKIAIEATDDLAGMWITTENAKSSSPMVSIYVRRGEAAVGTVGGFLDSQHFTAYDACISADRDGGHAQFSGTDRKPLQFTVAADGVLKPQK